jgi:hypothetical protein
MDGMRYRKKPVVIEAALFDGALVGEPGPSGRVAPGTCPGWFPTVTRDVTGQCLESLAVATAGDVYRDGDKLMIATREGVMTASPGDWIIRGIAGELYPCKPEIFAATYEPAS